jgi:hypothetical protein
MTEQTLRNMLIGVAAAILASQSLAQGPAAPPKLLIVISVDQLSADLFDEYRPQLTGGLARLARGTLFRNGYQSHAATETCPGHSTILTGVRPARNGIVANVWFDPAASRADKAIYCAEDEHAPGTSSTAYKVSPVHLRSATLGDLIKRASPASRNVAIGGKDRSAVMMGGAAPDQRWYWDGKQFATDLAAAPVPRSVTATNAALATALAAPAAGPEIAPACAAKAQVFPIAGGGKPVGAGTLARAGGAASDFRATPQFDAAVLALAAGLIQEQGLGLKGSTDLVSIGLAATDYVGHSYGSGGQEMCLQMLSLDRDLGDFLALLDRWGRDYAVALTADHGGLDIPERLRARGMADAAWIDPALAPATIAAKVAAKLGLASPLIAAGGPSGDIYLDPALKGAGRSRALAALAAAYRAHPQVAAAYTKAELAAAPLPTGDPAGWPLIMRVRASFDPARSGDLYVVLKPNVMPILDTSRYVATHGSPWDYDRRVPVIFWRPGMAPLSREEAVETVDIMPTLSAMLGLGGPPPDTDGKCLSGVQGVICPQR